jgi:4-hydroxybenzoate polyprenyltransferase
VPSLTAAPAQVNTSSTALKLRFILQASRPGLWLTAVWFYLLPCGGHYLIDSPRFWLGIVYVSFPLGLLIYGWNDCVDYAADQLNPRKGNILFGARGTREQLGQLPKWIVLVQLPFAVTFVVIGGWKMLGFFAAMSAACFLYNNLNFKATPPLEIANQAGYLLVFVLASWVNDLPQLNWAAMVFGAMFAMHSHVFGEVMDRVPDAAAGRKTTAVVIGSARAKLLMSAFLAVEAVLVWWAFRDTVITTFLAASCAWFISDALLLWRDRPYSPAQMKLAMIGWNAIALGSMYWVWSHPLLRR